MPAISYIKSLYKITLVNGQDHVNYSIDIVVGSSGDHLILEWFYTTQYYIHQYTLQEYVWCTSTL